MFKNIILSLILVSAVNVASAATVQVTGNVITSIQGLSVAGDTSTYTAHFGDVLTSLRTVNDDAIWVRGGVGSTNALAQSLVDFIAAGDPAFSSYEFNGLGVGNNFENMLVVRDYYQPSSLGLLWVENTIQICHRDCIGVSVYASSYLLDDIMPNANMNPRATYAYFSRDVSAVPLPATFYLMVTGMLAITGVVRSKPVL